MSRRFFVDSPLGLGDVTIDGDEAHHMVRVSRLDSGDAVTLFNGDGCGYVGTVVSTAKRGVVVCVERIDTPVADPPIDLHLVCAAPKGDRFDYLLEKITELGVAEFTPLTTERSIVKIDSDKLGKVRRAVIESAKQCGRFRLPVIHPAVSWADWVRNVEPSATWFAHPGGSPVLAIVQGQPNGETARRMVFAVGPEGGFSEGEVTQAFDRGLRAVSLGERILRIESAAVMIASVIAAEADRIGGTKGL